MNVTSFGVRYCSLINRKCLRGKHSFSQLQDILSRMKVGNEYPFPKEITSFGNSDMFSYATNSDETKSEIDTSGLPVWNQLAKKELDYKTRVVPLNGFEEMIQLTEEGKLWPYPIDNELGLDKEKEVPFEEHIFLDKHLEGFPKDENIRAFMDLILMGLSRNPYMTVDRKQKIIKFYRDYFESKRDTYKQAGYEI